MFSFCLQTLCSIVIKQVLLFISPTSTHSCLCYRAWLNLLKLCATPVMCGRSFLYALQGADLHCLSDYTVFGGKARNTVPKSKLFRSWLPRSCVFNIKVPDVLFLVLPSAEMAVGKKWKTQQTLCVTLKAAEGSVCVTKDAGCSRVLALSLREELWEWFPGWRLTAPSGHIEWWGCCECWWPRPTHSREFGLLAHSLLACSLPCDVALAWVVHPRARM